MPLTLSRSLMVILVPGTVALAPWVAYALLHCPALFRDYAPNFALVNAILFALVVIAGASFESLGSRLEVGWDKARESEFHVRENWLAYLAIQCKSEPIAFRYISRMVTTMYFELAVMFAAPVAFVGCGFLAFTNLHILAGLLLVVLAIAAAVFFYFEAKATHRVLCDVRQEVMSRIAVA